jgi:hypothetical protein
MRIELGGNNSTHQHRTQFVHRANLRTSFLPSAPYMPPLHPSSEPRLNLDMPSLPAGQMEQTRRRLLPGAHAEWTS